MVGEIARTDIPVLLMVDSGTGKEEYGRLFFFFNDPAPTAIYTLSLHDALPISPARGSSIGTRAPLSTIWRSVRTSSIAARSEEHTSELQSRFALVCRLLLE